MRESLPYLLGSAGMLTFDIITISQGLSDKQREWQLEEASEGDEEQEEVRQAEWEPLLTEVEVHH